MQTLQEKQMFTYKTPGFQTSFRPRSPHLQPQSQEVGWQSTAKSRTHHHYSKKAHDATAPTSQTPETVAHTLKALSPS